MQGDHQIFIRRNHPGRGAAAWARDHCPAGCICALIQIHAEPCGVLANPAPDFRRVLPDSGGEDQRVDPAEGGGHGAQFAADTVHEQSDRLLRRRIVAGQQGSHVVADAGNTKQSGLVIEKIAHLGRGHPLLLHQVENDARIEVAAPAAHGQAIERRKAHGRRYALALMDRTQACAAAEMGHDNTTIGGCRTEDVGQNACDVFIGKAVKPVPPDALGGEPARQRERRGDLGLRMMKGRVEARDLRQCGVKLREGVDGGKVVGLMERCQRNEAA